MNIEEIKEFLISFNIDSKVIEEYMKDKRMIEVKDNFYFTSENFENGKIFDSSLVYVQLEELLPSKLLLEFVRKHTENIVNLDSKKNALNFTYGKNVELPLKYRQGENYIITFNKSILGYAVADKKTLYNQVNVGDYLRES